MIKTETFTNKKDIECLLLCVENKYAFKDIKTSPYTRSKSYMLGCRILTFNYHMLDDFPFSVNVMAIPPINSVSPCANKDCPLVKK